MGKAVTYIYVCRQVHTQVIRSELAVLSEETITYQRVILLDMRVPIKSGKRAFMRLCRGYCFCLLCRRLFCWIIKLFQQCGILFCFSCYYKFYLVLLGITNFISFYLLSQISFRFTCYHKFHLVLFVITNFISFYLLSQISFRFTCYHKFYLVLLGITNFISSYLLSQI